MTLEQIAFRQTAVLGRELPPVEAAEHVVGRLRCLLQGIQPLAKVVDVEIRTRSVLAPVVVSAFQSLGAEDEPQPAGRRFL